MTPEEKFNQEVWWVLQKIKKEINKHPTSNTIPFRIQILPTNKDPQTPPPNKERLTLFNLAREEILFTFTKSVQQGNIDPIIGIDEYELTVDKKKLKKLYKKYKEGAQKNIGSIPQPDKEELIETTTALERSAIWKEGFERRFSFNTYGDLDEAIFFRWVADYVKFIMESLLLKGFIEKDINEEETKDHQRLNDLKEKSQRELDDTAVKLNNIIQKQKIPTSRGLRGAIDEYNGFRDGRIISSGYSQINEYGALCGIIRALLEQGLTDIVKNFTKINTFIATPPSNLVEVEKIKTDEVEVESTLQQIKTFSIEEFTFSSSFSELQEEIKYLEERRKHSIWGSWREIYLVYLVIHKKRDVWNELRETDNTLSALDFGVIVGEMDTILAKGSGSSSSQHGFMQFKKPEYAFHINRLHNYLLDKLGETITTNIPNAGIKKTISSKPYFSRDTEAIPHRLIIKDANGEYFYDGKRIEMGEESIYYKIFNILFTQGDQNSFVSYENIENGLQRAGEEKIVDTEEKNKRIHNALQNLFRFAKVNNKPLKNTTLDGRELIETKRGRGLKLNNPSM